MAFSAGSRPCLEALKSDLRGIQGGLKELLSATDGGSLLNIPSWRFPEKPAVSLNSEDLAKEISYCESSSREANCESHVLLLELAVDRLLLLLQCCLSLSDKTASHKSSSSSSYPLTIGSAAKKFSKKLVKDMGNIRELRQQIASKDERISAMEASTVKLQERCQLLQQALHDTIPTVAFSPGATQSNSDSRPATHGFKKHGLSASSVPYEAHGTLLMNRLNSATLLRTGDSSATAELEQSPVAVTNVTTHSVPLSHVANVDDTGHVQPGPSLTPKPNTGSVSTQTTETAFALCARCSDTQSTLVRVAGAVCDLCTRHSHSSSLAATDWAGQASVGGLELSNWEDSLRSDMNTIEKNWSELETKCRELSTELSSQKATVEKLEREIETLGEQFDVLQGSMEEIRQKSKASLAESKKAFAAQIRKLEAENDQWELRNGKMREALGATRKQEAHLKALKAELEQKHSTLLTELQALRDQESRLLSAKRGLEGEVECLQSQLLDTHEQLEGRTVEFKKTRAHALSLEKKNKTLQEKQAGLLSRLDELDLECAELSQTLKVADSSRDQLVSEVKRIQRECGTLQEQLEAEKDKVFQSVSEQQKLSRLVSELEGQLERVKGEVEEERRNVRLLMDYPFVKQTSEDYQRHVESLSGGESQRQISANTVRILLLEEQNSELREKVVVATKTGEGKRFQLKKPTKLWQDNLLPEEDKKLGARASFHSERDLKRRKNRSSQDRHSPAKFEEARLFIGTSHQNDTSEKSSCRQDVIPQSGSRLRGRLGHLVTAIAEAHQLASKDAASGNTGSSRQSESLESQGRSDFLNEVDLTQSQEQLGSSKEAGSASQRHLQPADLVSLNSSISDIEFHLCNKCDRMFDDRSEFEQHQSTCSHCH